MNNPQLMSELSSAIIDDRIRAAATRRVLNTIDGRAGPIARARHSIGHGLIVVGTWLAHTAGTATH